MGDKQKLPDYSAIDNIMSVAERHVSEFRDAHKDSIKRTAEDLASTAMIGGIIAINAAVASVVVGEAVKDRITGFIGMNTTDGTLGRGGEDLTL